MKKLTATVLVLVLVFVLLGCSQETKYKLEISDDSLVISEMKREYAAGEEVTIQLCTITEHYYIVSVNGQEIDKAPSERGTIYYSFTMPEEDVLVEIESIYVDIPYPPSYVVEDGETYLILPLSREKLWVREEEVKYLNKADGGLLEAAEEKINEEALKYTNNPSIHYEIHLKDEQLFLYGEIVVDIDPPEGGEAAGGCGIDHEHMRFLEKITK